MATFRARFKETGNFKAKFGEVTVIHTYDYEWYEGPYEVIPKAWEGQTLETEMKLMRQNVEVEEIPYAETSNVYGTTVTIAS